MKYSKFQDIELSALGFGCMRFPLLEDGKTIDEDQVEKMFEIAIKGGITTLTQLGPITKESLK